jgi:predicted  nucleic acid-binding Zn-ribbon protein
MGVEKIHACRNHCTLYRGDEYKDLDSCPNCGASRYKTNKDYREEDCATTVRTGKKRKKAQQKTQPTRKDKEEVDYYAQKKIPALVMWYLPVIDRLRCLFANAEDAQLMSWHVSDEHKNDGKLRHPSDGKQWQDFNANHPEFAKEPRNVRFALSTDGMNPFAERSSKHNTWPVILTIYNLPPWLMHKRKYLRACTTHRRGLSLRVSNLLYRQV